MRRTIFWLGLPLRYILAAMMLVVGAVMGETVLVDWKKLATHGFEEGVTP